MKLSETFDAPKRKWVVKNLSDLDQDVLDELWNMYEHTYKAIGLIVSNINQMVSKYKISLLIDVDKDPLPDAFTIYKPTKFGVKMVLSGTDGSKEGKSALVKHKLQSLKKRGWYIEASHRMAEILSKPQVEDSILVLSPKHTDMNLTLDEISLENLTQYDGVLLKNSNIREDYDVMVVGIINGSGETNINPEPDTVLYTTDTVLLMGEVGKMNRFKENLPS